MGLNHQHRHLGNTLMCQPCRVVSTLFLLTSLKRQNVKNKIGNAEMAPHAQCCPCKFRSRAAHTIRVWEIETLVLGNRPRQMARVCWPTLVALTMNCRSSPRPCFFLFKFFENFICEYIALQLLLYPYYSSSNLWPLVIVTHTYVNTTC